MIIRLIFFNDLMLIFKIISTYFIISIFTFKPLKISKHTKTNDQS